MTSQNVGQDHLAVIRIEGMHSYRCEKAIEKALGMFPGVHEVEVDFAAALASVLYDGHSVTVGELMQAVTNAGYRAVEYAQR